MNPAKSRACPIFEASLLISPLTVIWFGATGRRIEVILVDGSRSLLVQSLPISLTCRHLREMLGILRDIAAVDHDQLGPQLGELSTDDVM